MYAQLIAERAIRENERRAGGDVVLSQNHIEYSDSCSSDLLGFPAETSPFFLNCTDLQENATFLCGTVRALKTLERLGMTWWLPSY
jgi:hypothetical protein